MKRVFIASTIALGLSAVSIALGMLYLDYTRREGAWVEAGIRGAELSEQDQDELLNAWRVHEFFVPSLIAGTAGVGLLGLGLTLVVFELPVFRITKTEQSLAEHGSAT